ncbi:MAG: hypothetical protein HRT87_07745 [Legionellales bacterium]|nr:hypothetical protein [Legionellales bacterium]
MYTKSYLLFFLLLQATSSYGFLVIVKNNSPNRDLKIKALSINQESFYKEYDTSSIDRNSRKIYIPILKRKDKNKFCNFYLSGSFGALKLAKKGIVYHHFIVNIKSQRELNNSDIVMITIDHDDYNGAYAALDIAEEIKISFVSILKSRINNFINFRKTKGYKDNTRFPIYSNEKIPDGYVPALIQTINMSYSLASSYK